MYPSTNKNVTCVFNMWVYSNGGTRSKGSCQNAYIQRTVERKKKTCVNYINEYATARVMRRLRQRKRKKKKRQKIPKMTHWRTRQRRLHTTKIFVLAKQRRWRQKKRPNANDEDGDGVLCVHGHNNASN